MSEMTSIPILSSVPTPASSVQPSGTAATSPGTSSAATTPGTASADKTGNISPSNAQGSDASPAEGNVSDSSFARILKRQQAQSTTNGHPLASELAATVLPASTTTAAPLMPDLIATQPLSNIILAPDTRKGLPDPNPAVAPNLDSKQPLSSALVSELTTQPQASASAAVDAAPIIPDIPVDPKADAVPAEEVNVGQTINLIPLPKSVALAAKSLKESAASSDHPAKQDDGPTQQDMAGNSLAALLAYFPPIVPNNTAKSDIALPTTEKKPALANMQLLAAGTPALIQSNPDKEGNNPSPLNLDETALPTSSKAADFAAIRAVSADAVPSQANKNESAGTENSFENILATTQLSSQVRGTETHVQTTPSHSATPLTVQTPVGTHGWDGEVSDKLVWMIGRQEQRAELVLNPPQLGRVEVSLTMNGDQTNATFVSTNPAVRDALETALPRLREMLADAGISLGQAQVGSDPGSNAANQSTNNRGNEDNSSRFSNRSDLVLGSNILGQTGNSQWLKQGSSLVDIFA